MMNNSSIILRLFNLHTPDVVIYTIFVSKIVKNVNHC
jgi:hypothetical protein